MKKLICAKDIETFLKEESKVFYISDDMIITPSAKDLAKANGIEFLNEVCKCEVKTSDTLKNCSENIDCEKFLELFKSMMQKGILQEMLDCLKKEKNMPYDFEADSSGLKVVRGNTVKMDVFDTGDPDVKAYFQELVSKDESKISAGFLVIENSSFPWELTYEEIDYVIEGTLTIEINGKKFTAYPGDVLFVPSGSKVVWGSPDKARIFYATYPANWADLI